MMVLLTEYWAIGAVVLMITVVTGIYMYATRNFLYWKKRGVMEIPPTAFVGNFADCLLMKRSPGHFEKDLYDQTANLPYMGFYIFDRPYFLVRDPELIKNMLIRDFNYFTDRHATICPGDSIGRSMPFFLKNPGWKLVRSKLTLALTPSKIKKIFESMLEIGKNLDTCLNSLNLQGKGCNVEMKELCAKFMTDITGITAYGLHVNSLKNPDAAFRKNGREMFTFNIWRGMEMTGLFFGPQFVDLMGFRFVSNKNGEFLRQVFWETVVDRERSGVKKNDLIDLLIDLKKNQPESEKHIFEFDGDNLVAQSAAFFVAGFETSSTAMCFTLYELALATEVQQKLREEITNGLKQNDGKITYDMVMALPYLDMVVSEALRMYPAVPVLDRIVMADYKVPNSNLVLPKGMPVHIPMLGLHYDPEYFPNPETFDPERFSEKNKKNRKSIVYMPFGDGPRGCIGMRLGLLQSKLGIIHIVMNYELSASKETLIPMKLNTKAFVTAAEGGLYLNLRKLTK